MSPDTPLSPFDETLRNIRARTVMTYLAMRRLAPTAEERDDLYCSLVTMAMDLLAVATMCQDDSQQASDALTEQFPTMLFEFIAIRRESNVEAAASRARGGASLQ